MVDGKYHCPYCVSNPQAPDELIQRKLDFLCGEIPASCDLIQPKQPCYVPNDLRTTASFVFNDWAAGGLLCDFEGAAIVVHQDPSNPFFIFSLIFLTLTNDFILII